MGKSIGVVLRRYPCHGSEAMFRVVAVLREWFSNQNAVSSKRGSFSPSILDIERRGQNKLNPRLQKLDRQQIEDDSQKYGNR